MSRNDFKVDVSDVVKALNKLDKIPKKVFNRSAKAGAKLILPDAKKLAPKQTGALRKGLKLVKEKTNRKYKYKAIYDVMPDPKKNESNWVVIRPNSRVYYPNVAEKRTHFIRNASSKNAVQVTNAIVSELDKEIDKL